MRFSIGIAYIGRKCIACYRLRLLQCAMLSGADLGAAIAAAIKLKGVTQKAVAAEFRVSQPSVSEWIRFGRIDKKHISHLIEYFSDVAAAEHWGLSTSTAWTPEHHPSEGVAVHPVAQAMILPEPDDESPLHPWEFILSVPLLDLPKRFRVAIPDGALAPLTPKGTVFSFIAPPPAEPPGESVVVIVQTAGGRRFARLFFALDGGAWEARARDSAFPSFHSTRDGLQLIAVATARVGGEG